MSKTYNLVGEGNVEKAVLVVTVTNGTPTSVTATKTGSSVSLVHDSTNDIWTGNVTPGTWTVTATDGTNSGSISVTVDEVKVYSRIVGMSELGGDYTKLEWISSTGAAINTGYYPVSACRVYMKLQLMKIVVWSSLFASFEPSGTPNRKLYGTELSSSGYINYYNDSPSESLVTAGQYSLDTVYTLSTNGKTITVNGTNYTGSYMTLFTSPSSATMKFGANIKTWYFQMTDSGGSTLVRNMVPARRNSDSVVGMYDKVNGAFYGSANSSVFTAGPAA